MRLMVPVWFFVVFMIMGSIKLYKGIAGHNALHIGMSVAGIVLSVIGIILIAPSLKKGIKTP